MASTVSVPYTFTPNTTILSAQVNANFQALAQGFGNIDHSDVGPAGFYASQIIPIDAPTATFGGALPYTFVNDVATLGNFTAAQALMVGPSLGVQTVIRQNQAQIQGPVQAIKLNGVSLGTLPPLLTAAGSDFGTASHIVQGKSLISIPSGASTGQATIVLTGDAVFLLEPVVNVDFVGKPSVPGWTSGVVLYVGNQVSVPYNVIQVNAYSPNATTSVSTALLNFFWQATGV